VIRDRNCRECIIGNMIREEKEKRTYRGRGYETEDESEEEYSD
jgi:hypothetical protein